MFQGVMDEIGKTTSDCEKSSVDSMGKSSRDDEWNETIHSGHEEKGGFLQLLARPRTGAQKDAHRRR